MFSTFSPPDSLPEIEPLFAAPTGPVWELAADEILEAGDGTQGTGAQTYLVRRLPNVQSMLTVGPLLEQVTRFDHPRLWGPSFWTRADEGVWVASARPRGERLSQAGLERKSFAEALELWRPVAEAVARLHRKGVVHGTIAPWTLWVDEASWKACAIDAGCWIGDDFAQLAPAEALWLAGEMRVSAGEREPGPATDVYGLARLLVDLTLPTEQSRRTRPNLTGLPAYAIPAIEAALQEEASARPARVAELVSAMAPVSFHQTGSSDQTGSAPEGEQETAGTMSVMYARVSGIERIEHPKLGRGVKFFVNRPDVAPPNDQMGAFFYEKQAPEVFEGVKWVWEGCELNLLDARVVENSAGERFLTGQSDTLPVLEPHMPMSVSNVLKAEGCPSRFLVDQRDRGGSSRALVFGNLVHGLMDDLVEPEPPGFEDAFDARAKSLRLDMLAAGLGDRDMSSIQKDARQHFDNIRRFTAPRTHDAPDHDRMGWSGRNAEVTRYSTRYGIEGRVDLVAQDEREGLQIVELKSGSTWDGHFSQLRFYKFLWDGFAKAHGMEVNGHLLYSRHGRMQSAPMDDTARERRILCARNELIACMRSFVDPDYDYRAPFFMQNPRACRSGSCKFRRDRCQKQTEVLGLADGVSPWDAAGELRGAGPEVVARAWAWHEHFARLVEMERWASTAELGKVLHGGRLEERKQEFHAVDGLEVSRVQPKAGFVEFEGAHGQVFSPGDYVVAHRGDFHTQHILRGRITGVERGRISVSTRGAAIAADLQTGGWILDKLPARLGFRQAHHALYGALENGSPDRLEVLFRPDGAQAKELLSATAAAAKPEETASLNPSQAEAVRVAIGSPQGALIQGPPGTGKTTVIAHAVRELVAQGKRVLVSAFTNTAVDTILTKLLEVGCDSFLRIGHASRSPELTRRIEHGGHDVAQFFSGDLAAATDSLDALSEELLGRQVIASTTHRCVSSPEIDFLQNELGPVPFDIAIVDEAAQITEPMTLAAINLGRRFALVGDHRQLPPIVENEQTHTNFIEDLGREELAPMGCFGLDRSLFERLVEKLPHVMLDEQYRMNADIMAYSNRGFYDGKLRAHASVAEHTLDVVGAKLEALVQSMGEPIGEILAPERPLVFADVEHDEASRIETNQRHNEAEAEALVETVAALFEACDEPASVGVVSPFRAQVHLIRKLLGERLGKRAELVEVDTVERFQGSERDVILVSLVKTERAGDFLADERRLNVTLTRAKKKLVVFGSRECLELNPLYRGLIEQPETCVVTWSE